MNHPKWIIRNMPGRRDFLRDWIQLAPIASRLKAAVWHGAFVLVLAASFIFVAFISPSDIPLPACRFLQATGRPCPFCGYTRAFHYLAHGRLMKAFHDCPLSIPFCLVAVVILLWHSVPLLSGYRLQPGPKNRISKRGWIFLLITALVLIFLNWIYRLSMGLR